jgi:hypothetical protein
MVYICGVMACFVIVVWAPILNAWSKKYVKHHVTRALGASLAGGTGDDKGASPTTAASTGVPVLSDDNLSSFVAANGWSAVIVDPAKGRPYVLLRNPARDYRLTMYLPHPGKEAEMVCGLVAAIEFLAELTPDIHIERTQS